MGTAQDRQEITLVDAPEWVTTMLAIHGAEATLQAAVDELNNDDTENYERLEKDNAELQAELERMTKAHEKQLRKNEELRAQLAAAKSK